MKPSREIRQLRRAAGITAQQLDKLCFFSEGLIEKIETNKLIVPGCCHYICVDCNNRCDKCPICREEYV